MPMQGALVGGAEGGSHDPTLCIIGEGIEQYPVGMGRLGGGQSGAD
jgi:hypothetical protein